MHGYMKSIPFELEEAAVIDGATFFQRFSKIVFPLSKSGLVTAGTFVFLFGWNEFIYALLLTSRRQVRTVQFGIRHFVHQFFTDYTAIFAAIVALVTWRRITWRRMCRARSGATGATTVASGSAIMC